MARGVRIKACTCVSLDPSLHFKAAQAALAENPDNHPTGLLGHPAAIHLIGKTWAAGRTLNVEFLDGSPAQRQKVARWLVEWTSVANISFVFTGPAPSDIRVTFTPGGSWSFIGTDCLSAPSGAVTMQLGWVTDASDDDSDRAVILHEFGHAIGLGHEQQHPDEDIHWDKPKAVAWYARTQGWDLATIQENVFDVFDRSQVAGTTYDRTSIMQYPVPAELTTDGRGIGWNTDLSPLDISHIAGLYPRAADPTAPIVVPPSPPATPLPSIDLDGDAAESAIPSPGFPAKFTLPIAEQASVRLTVIVERSHQMPITAQVSAEGMTTLKLGIPAAGGTFLFNAGDYEIDVYHPLANAVGRVWVEAESQ